MDDFDNHFSLLRVTIPFCDICSKLDIVDKLSPNLPKVKLMNKDEIFEEFCRKIEIMFSHFPDDVVLPISSINIGMDFGEEEG